MADRDDLSLERWTNHETVRSGETSVTSLLELPTVTLSSTFGHDASADFQLGAVLGQGGMGEVVEAQQLALQRTVAIKRPRTVEDSTGPLVREAIATGRLEHPGIVPVHLLARSADQTPLFVMKRIEGQPWSALLSTRELEANLETLVRVCDAVAFAHGRGVVHRDVKPANVMLGAFGEVYLVDWGLAASTRVDVVLPLVSEVGVGGTPAYMAPEQARQGASIGPWTDVYLLGATLCELVTGQPPHRATSVDEALASAAQGSLPDFRGVPEDLAALCRRAMAVAPEARFASVRDFQLGVQRSLRARGALALHARVMDRLGVLEAAAPGSDHSGVFVECRFGFEEVRRQYPGFAPAGDGLRRTLIAMAKHELARGAVSAARGLVDQLEAPAPELLAAVVGAEARALESQARLAQLEANEREASNDAASSTKARFVSVFALVVALGSATLGVGYLLAPHLFTTARGAALILSLSLSSIIYARIIKRAPDANLRQRRVALALRINWSVSMGLWLLAWRLDLPFFHTVVFYLWLNAGLWAVSSVYGEEVRARPVAVAFFVSALVALLVPTIAFFVNGLLMGAAFWRLGRSLSQLTPKGPG
jgi:eukaryotic-like serine/threonine-protein kinase